MAARVPLRLFNGKFAVNDIFGLKNADEVKEFVRVITQSPEDHGVAPQNVPECLKALNHFLAFDFKSGKNKPLFYLKDDALDPKTYSRNGIDFNAHTPFHSFVHGLSLTKVPENTTRDNFYLPMAAALGSAVQAIGGKRAPSTLSIIFEEGGQPAADASPFMISTTEPTHVIGTSIPKPPGKATDWREQVQRDNWKWLKERGAAIPFDDPKKSYFTEQNKYAQLFGHCAETHAFVIKLLTTDPTTTPISGFTLRNWKLKKAGSYEKVLENLSSCVMDPCENCRKAIIDGFHADPRRFLVEAEGYFNL